MCEWHYNLENAYIEMLLSLVSIKNSTLLCLFMNPKSAHYSLVRSITSTVSTSCDPHNSSERRAMDACFFWWSWGTVLHRVSPRFLLGSSVAYIAKESITCAGSVLEEAKLWLLSSASERKTCRFCCLIFKSLYWKTGAGASTLVVLGGM